MNHRIAYLLAGAGLVSLAMADPALAQPAAPPATKPGGLDDIIVYAQKKSRGEELQKVPLAVTAVDSRLLEASHSIDLRDVGHLVPNSQLDGVGTFPGFANFFIRGVGVSTSVRSLDPAVIIVQDGMVIGFQAGAVLDTFDLEGVEVLRGPQGVLFGRNASGGAVNLRSKRPTGKFAVHGDVSFGNATAVETHASVEGALVPDRIFVRLSAQTRTNDGYTRNDNRGIFVAIPTSGPTGTFNVNPTGAPPPHRTGGIPGTNELVIKPTIVFAPAAGTKLTLLGQYQRYRDGGGATRLYVPPQGTLSNEQRLWGYTPPPGKYRTNIANEGYTDISGHHLIAELVQDIGPGVLTAIAAHRKLHYNSTLNVSGDPFSTIIFPDNRETARQTSLEARYNVPLAPSLDLLVGGFWFDQDSDVREYRQIRVATSTLISNRINFWDQKVKSYAGFANLDWNPTERLTVSAGLRYSHDAKRMHIIPLSVCSGQNFTGCNSLYYNSSAAWHDLSPRLVANYRPSRSAMLYASYAKGYRAGNYNARAVTVGSALTPANPESVRSIEAGVKSEFLDHHLRANVDVFREKYSDIQRIVQVAIPGESPAQNLFNAAKATIEGVEGELAVSPVQGLRFDGNIGYTHARYRSFIGLTGLPAGASPTGLEFDRVPKWTVYAGVTYDRYLAGLDGRVSAHAGYSWRSHMFTDVLNKPELEQRAYSLIDASLRFTKGRWSAELFGRNLANTEYADIKSLNTGYNAYGGQPRTYGVRIGFTY